VDHIKREIEADGRYPTVFDVPELAVGPGAALLLTTKGADWVVPPEELDLGVSRLYVKDRGLSDCPKCAEECEVYVLEHEIAVHNCGGCAQFFWVRWPGVSTRTSPTEERHD
jgi:hypothetical protein